MSLRIVVALSLASIGPGVPVTAQESAAARSPAIAKLAGRYVYRDREMVAEVDLRPDATFDYKIYEIRPAVKGRDTFRDHVSGVWRVNTDGDIVMTNAPSSAPIMRQTSAVRDPRVRAALTIIKDGGKPLNRVGLLTDGGANGQLRMLSNDGRYTIPLRGEDDFGDGKVGKVTALPRMWEIVRAADDRSLAKITLTPGGPNHFTFHYVPSPIEPFEYRAGPVEGQRDMLEVQVGTGSLKLRRVR